MMLASLCIPVTSAAPRRLCQRRVAELGTTVGVEQQNLHADVDRTGRTASDAAARADAANGGLSSATVALGNVDFRTANPTKSGSHSTPRSFRRRRASRSTWQPARCRRAPATWWTWWATPTASDPTPTTVTQPRRADAVLRHLLEHGPGPVGATRSSVWRVRAHRGRGGGEDREASRRVAVNLPRVEAGSVPLTDQSPATTQISRAEEPKKTTSHHTPATTEPTLQTDPSGGSR